MLTKNDLLLLLSNMDKTPENLRIFNKAALSDGISMEVLSYINKTRPLEITNFYELIRKNYNNKKSNLYKNLVRETFNSGADVITTLSALNLQISLYAKKLEDDKLFIKSSRAAEISSVLKNYYETFDLVPCLKLLKLIKADLKCFENMNK